MTIGAFAERARLSPKALRLYGRLGLLVPASIDPATGYRLYREDQVDQARTIALLRRIGMPLVSVADVLAATPDVAVKLLDMIDYDVQTRQLPRRRVLTINRHLHMSETDAFFDDAFARLRAVGPGCEGIDGAPYLIFYGEVSEESDGPLELCRPIRDEVQIDGLDADIQLDYSVGVTAL